MENVEPTRARKKADKAWDLHRGTIEALYHTNPLEGENGVMELMKRDHKFRARYADSPLRSSLY
jgi:hypothetical protein